MKLNVHIRSSRGAVQAYCPDLPGCSAAAPNEAEALRLLRERLAELLAAAPRAVLPCTRVIQIEV